MKYSREQYERAAKYYDTYFSSGGFYSDPDRWVKLYEEVGNGRSTDTELQAKLYVEGLYGGPAFSLGHSNIARTATGLGGIK